MVDQMEEAANAIITGLASAFREIIESRGNV
jgi:hypothetical protein